MLQNASKRHLCQRGCNQIILVPVTPGAEIAEELNAGSKIPGSAFFIKIIKSLFLVIFQGFHLAFQIGDFLLGLHVSGRALTLFHGRHLCF